ncbi:hypothetical protein QTQ03_20520 [Micromonospora sp. WMMA1363]|uniref:hypothetical protein n=1 Tax=Micromonospora sp. WMMA1363 TaxID=3053985 RepID=UPI00259CD694|nr:hypothetical protein [Micromonospora sp. WMMA1363]MDM4721864.1 hypothetical protein [Micromonospora sp. WMMA1363]
MMRAVQVAITGADGRRPNVAVDIYNHAVPRTVADHPDTFRNWVISNALKAIMFASGYGDEWLRNATYTVHDIG